MYADDNNDAVATAGNWIGGSMGLSLVATAGMTNTQAIKDARLYKYNESIAIYQDPAEQPWPFWQSPKVKRVRSYALDSNSGQNNGSGIHNQNNTPYQYGSYNKTGQIKFPGPSGSLTFLDECESGIDDGIFALEVPDARFARWRNEPSSRHGASAVLGFADGHSEMFKETQPYLYNGSQFQVGVPGNIAWDNGLGITGSPAGSVQPNGNGFPAYYPPLGYNDPDLIKMSKFILDKKSWDAAEGRTPQSIYAF